MKKTHKKILGFTGLGLVAAVTTFAAVLPTPEALAIGVTDQITVTVTSPEPQLMLSTTSGSTITSPAHEYAFTVSYGHAKTVTISLVNKNDEGGIINTATIWEGTGLDGTVATKDFNLDLNNYGGFGNFTITATGEGEDGVPLSDVLTVVYKKAEKEEEPDDSGDVPIEPVIPQAEVKSATVTVYDESGAEVYNQDFNDPKAVDTINLSHLPNGTYTMVVISRDAEGNEIDRQTKIIIINKEGGGSTNIKEPIQPQDETIGQVVITITNANGDNVYDESLNNPTPGAVVSINTSGFPAGTYTMTTEYFNLAGTRIKVETKTFTVSDGEGNVDPEIPEEVDTVETIEAVVYNDEGEVVRIVKVDRETGTVYVYDKDGNLLYTIPNGYTGGEFNVPLEGLDDGNYKIVVSYRDGDGRLVGGADTYKVNYEKGKAPVIVPDTGSFFASLNISREDYLITGLVVFLIVGVVAFGVVAKNKRNNSVSKKNRK